MPSTVEMKQLQASLLGVDRYLELRGLSQEDLL
jgi:hypothetical protein